jgi:hypothetical protein
MTSASEPYTYIGGLLVLIYVTFFHDIYDIDIWKLKNAVLSVLLGYWSQTGLCILITPSKLAMCNNIIGMTSKTNFVVFPLSVPEHGYVPPQVV